MSKEDENEDKKVSGLFDQGFELYQKISKSNEPTNSGQVQLDIRKAIEFLEDSTRLVSFVGLFSSNEGIEEIATADLKLLLLPALLAQLTLKLYSENRLNIIQTAEIYFKDFLQRCKDYGITDYDIKNNDEESSSSSETSEAVALPQKNAGLDLFKMAQERNKKLQRYRDQKALEEELSKLKEVIARSDCDEDSKRKYFISLVKSFVNQSIDEIKSIEMEKPILEHMAKVRSPGTMAHNELDKKVTKSVLTQPLKAVIITKDEVQKQVFGTGYPSLPRMSVAEFYESRIADGTFVAKPSVRISMQDKAIKEDESRKQEEMEAGIQEKLIEQDDEEELARARAMDEYKDEFKRGWGNRYNRS